MHSMQKILTELHETVHTMHRLPKLLLKYGGMLVILLFTASVAAYLCAGRLGDYHALMILSGDLFVCGKDTLAATKRTAGYNHAYKPTGKMPCILKDSLTRERMPTA